MSSLLQLCQWTNILNDHQPDFDHQRDSQGGVPSGRAIDCELQAVVLSLNRRVLVLGAEGDVVCSRLATFNIPLVWSDRIRPRPLIEL